MKRTAIFLAILVLLLFLAPKAFACTTTINAGLTIDTSCGFSGIVVGVDNGDITTSSEATLTVLNGQTVIWNNGKSIFNDGSIVFIGTAQIVKSNLWCTDADADGYCANQTYEYGESTPGTGYRRLMGMATISIIDCDDDVPGPGSC